MSLVVFICGKKFNVAQRCYFFQSAEKSEQFYEVSYDLFWLNVFLQTATFIRLNSCVYVQERIVGASREVGWPSAVELDAARRWTFPGAFLYSVSLITTVGKRLRDWQ